MIHNIVVVGHAEFKAVKNTCDVHSCNGCSFLEKDECVTGDIICSSLERDDMTEAIYKPHYRIPIKLMESAQ